MNGSEGGHRRQLMLVKKSLLTTWGQVKNPLQKIGASSSSSLQSRDAFMDGIIEREQNLSENIPTSDVRFFRHMKKRYKSE